jgi:putative lipoprotein
MAKISVILVAGLASLAGSEWVPENGGGAPNRFIQFGESDVTGFGGCNRFAGRYTFDGAAIKIGPLASTRMACPPEVMDAEQAWFQMLERASGAVVTPAELQLKDATGGVAVTLKRRNRD